MDGLERGSLETGGLDGAVLYDGDLLAGDGAGAAAAAGGRCRDGTPYRDGATAGGGP